ncbi:MAG TPA: DUF1573 domain-containing protein [Thermoanaerobaculia bacterium]|nr:DUF1573 domain-containing protein [Thermoanaerobaculia bacterium]
MSDDFGTVNVRRGERSREIEVLRQQYRGHRDALARLAADAPTEQLAAEYQRLLTGIDEALRKLDDLEGRPATQPGTRPVPPPSPSMTAPGMRPLSGEPVTEPQRYVTEEPPAPNTGARTLLIVVVGLLVLGAIGYLIWRASRERPPRVGTTTGTVVEQPVTPATADTIAPATTAPSASTIAPATSGGSLKITPVMADYGIVRKGTRAVRQFEAVNNGAAPIEIQLARSNCHCLFYEFRPIPAHGKGTITVAIDGAKAKAGTVDEQLTVTAKNDPTVSATIGIRAVVK